MEDKKVTAAEIKALLANDFDRFAEKMAAAMNEAKAGRIIADSEVPVFEANGTFRRETFEKIVSLVQEKHEAFSPSARRACQQGDQASDAFDD